MNITYAKIKKNSRSPFFKPQPAWASLKKFNYSAKLLELRVFDFYFFLPGNCVFVCHLKDPCSNPITGKKNPSSSCSAWPPHWHRDYIGSPTGKKVCPKYSYYLFSPVLPERKKVVILIKIRCWSLGSNIKFYLDWKVVGLMRLWLWLYHVCV